MVFVLQVLVTPALSGLLEAYGLMPTYLWQSLICLLAGIVAFWVLEKAEEGVSEIQELEEALAYRRATEGNQFKASTTVKFMFLVGDFLGVWALYNLYSPKSKDALLEGAGAYQHCTDKTSQLNL